MDLDASSSPLDSPSLESLSESLTVPPVPALAPVPQAAQRQRARKPRKTITHDIVHSFIVQYNSPDAPSLKQIARNLNLSYTATKELLKKIRASTTNAGDETVVELQKPGRKRILDPEQTALVRTLLTELQPQRSRASKRSLGTVGSLRARRRSGERQ